MRRYWSYILLGTSIFLAGCSSTNGDAESDASSPHKNVCCPNEDVGYSPQACQQKMQQQSLAQKVRGDGIQVVQVGEETTLVLPSDNFFEPNSNHAAEISSGVMKDVADFINSYPDVIDVKVTGYPQNSGESVRNMALSRARAERIAHELQVNGLAVRLISADTKRNLSDVPRTEIFFRLAPPKNVFH